MTFRCTTARDRIKHLPIWHCQRVVDDIEVQDFLRDQFFQFRPDLGEIFTGRELLLVARKKFGIQRCLTIWYWEH